MGSSRQIIERMYDALRQADAKAMVALLHPDCVVRTAPGLPFAGGRTARGPVEALAEVWGVVNRHYAVAPEPDTYIEADNGQTVVGIGTYRGAARSTGRPVEAWFAHRWTVADGQIIGLQQITDTVRWAHALQGEDSRHDTDGPVTS